MDWKERFALITGASSGLGVDFAEILAEKGCNLVLTARREKHLQILKTRLRNEYDVGVIIIPMDLSVADAPRKLYDQLKAQGVQIDVLINNAGFGLYGPFVEQPWERLEQMLMLDIQAVAQLTRLFAEDMLTRDIGYILQVASIAAYQPSPTYAAYAAAKSWVLSFSEALAFELRERSVNITVLSPGVTATEFLEVAGQKPTLYQRIVMMQSRDVAEIGIRAMLKGKTSVVAGFLNKLGVFSMRFLPRAAQAAIAYMVMREDR